MEKDVKGEALTHALFHFHETEKRDEDGNLTKSYESPERIVEIAKVFENYLNGEA